MDLKQLLLIVSLFFICSCQENFDPISSVNVIYESDYGIVTQIDEYPLYELNYTADYEFDEYLQTSIFPASYSNTTNNRDFSCTCFSAFGEDSRLFGRNYDWTESSTYFILFTNPPDGYASVSTVDLSFFNYDHTQLPDYSGNQNTIRMLPYYPFDGINEKGVAIGMNAVPYANPPYDNAKVTIGELQLIRLVLDYAASVQEAVFLIQNYNIVMENPPIHYLIADSSGHSLIVEFVNGNMEIIDDSNTWQVTTNFIITGVNVPNEAPCWRYRTAYETLYNNAGAVSENEAMSLLQDVSVSITRWSTVFNLRDLNLQIAMGRGYGNLYNFNLLSH